MGNPISIRLDDAVLDRLDALAAREGRTRSNLSRYLLLRALEELEGSPRPARSARSALREPSKAAPASIRDLTTRNPDEIVHNPEVWRAIRGLFAVWSTVPEIAAAVAALELEPFGLDGDHVQVHPLDLRAAWRALRGGAEPSPWGPTALEQAVRAHAIGTVSSRPSEWTDDRVTYLVPASALAFDLGGDE